ncbi:hypothetical protein TWF173_010434 [Orbilia oligospora]|nr:hypothetical protein TWF173_010434 [Orbilia oligospora]
MYLLPHQYWWTWVPTQMQAARSPSHEEVGLAIFRDIFDTSAARVPKPAAVSKYILGKRRFDAMDSYPIIFPTACACYIRERREEEKDKNEFGTSSTRTKQTEAQLIIARYELAIKSDRSDKKARRRQP